MLETIVLVQIPLIETPEIRTGVKEIYLGNNLRKSGESETKKQEK